jgi:uncharacterized protein (TIGR00661 family)
MIVKRLREMGHEVMVVLSGDLRNKVMNIEDFAPYVRMRGMFFHIENGKVDPFKTALLIKPFTFIRDLFRLPRGRFDLVITDYEPLTAYYALFTGHFSIGHTHNYAFNFKEVPQPKLKWYERITLRIFAPARLYLVLHWFPYNRNTVPPFIKDLEPGPTDKDRYLVYFPFEEPEAIIPVLREVPELDFVYYCGRNERIGNVVLKDYDRSGFLADMKRVEGVIASAGFMLSSEVMHLGKKMLLKPLASQVEQQHNAAEAERLGLAMRTDSLTPEVIREFRTKPQPERRAFPDMVEIFCRWVDAGALAGQWKITDELVEQMWGQDAGDLLSKSS